MDKTKTYSKVVEKTHSSPRVKSGIPGLDELIGGGFIPNRVYLIMGTAGAGKTIFCTQFIHNGIVNCRENGIFITLEVPPEQLREDMLSLGWDLKKLEDEGKLILIDATLSRIGYEGRENFAVPRPYTTDSLLFEIQSCIQKIKAKRIVIDSLNALDFDVNPIEHRKSQMKLNMILRSFKCTCLITAEYVNEKRINDEIGAFTADGVIMLHYALEKHTSIETVLEQASSGKSIVEEKSQIEVASRKFEISKMRGTNHSQYLHPFIISEGGIQLRKPEIAKKTSTVHTNLD